MIPPFHWWRTVFWLIPTITVYTVVLGAVSLGSVLVDRHGRVAHWCARTWSWLILATTGVEVRTSGVERVPPGKSYVFVSNHQSIYDIPILFCHVPFQLRIIAKASLGAFPVLGWHLRYTGHVLVERDRAGAKTLRQVATLMRHAHSLIVFPEGTRSSDGQVGRFKTGLFLLAVEAGLPVVPVAIVGSRHVMRKGRLMTCPGQVELVVHDPIPTQGLSRADVRDLARRAGDVIATTVAQRRDGDDQRSHRDPARKAIRSIMRDQHGQPRGRVRKGQTCS